MDKKDEHEAKATEDNAAEQHGGKFSLLGRECKAEEEEGPETTPGSPPLDVDDPGTPGCNGWEINIVGEGEFGKGMDAATPLFDINYGIGDNIQLKVEAPYELSRLDGVSSSGVGAAEVGIKYRFYDNDESDTSIAIYPQFEFAIPGTALADAHEGTRTILPVLMSTKLGETSKGDVMITGNLGYNLMSSSEERSYVSASLGVGLPLTKRIGLMVEASTEQAIGNNDEGVRAAVYKANLGMLGRINDNLMLFGALGQSYTSGEMEDANHTCVVLGLRVLAGGP